MTFCPTRLTSDILELSNIYIYKYIHVYMAPIKHRGHGVRVFKVDNLLTFSQLSCVFFSCSPGLQHIAQRQKLCFPWYIRWNLTYVSEGTLTVFTTPKCELWLPMSDYSSVCSTTSSLTELKGRAKPSNCKRLGKLWSAVHSYGREMASFWDKILLSFLTTFLQEQALEQTLLVVTTQ